MHNAEQEFLHEKCCQSLEVYQHGNEDLLPSSKKNHLPAKYLTPLSDRQSNVGEDVLILARLS